MNLSVAALLVAGSISAVQAGGFQLMEQSVTSLGRAHAGAGVVGDDVSAVWYNPAGMTLLPGTQFQFGGVFAALDIPAEDYRTGQTDNGRKHPVPIPNMFLSHQINDSAWFGIGLTVPYGMATEYGREFSMGDKGMNSEIKVFDLNPSFAYKVSDKLSVGIGASIEYAQAFVESGMMYHPLYKTPAAYGRYKATSWSGGFNAGVMWTPVETVRLGLSYRSAVKHSAKGQLKIGTYDGDHVGYVSALASTSKGAKATIKAPHQINLSATWEVTPSWRLSGLIHWSDWSSFKSLDISSDNALLPYKLGTSKISIANNWKDSWLFSVGTDYRFNDSVTVRGGIAYEKSPVRDNYRLAIIPDLDRMWFTIGATWHVTKQLQGDFGFAWIHGIGNKSVYDNNNPSKEIGKFRKCESYLFGAQMVYKF
ncbi:MAG TPA: hypothetical protein DEO49_05295 [Sutterella sp.]|nr:hypothetical protein [Sutterella sp.]